MTGPFEILGMAADMREDDDMMNRTPLKGLAIVVAIDEDADIRDCLVITPDLGAEEILDMLESMSMVIRELLIERAAE